MSESIPDEVLTAITEAIFHHRKIEAIKLYRECTGVGLKEAKEAVEKLEGELRQTAPEKFTASAAGKGCAGVLLFGLAAAGVLLGRMAGML